MAIGSILLVLLFLAFTWGLTLTRIEHERQTAIRDTTGDCIDVAAIVKANLDQVISKTTIYSNLAAGLIDGDPGLATYLNPSTHGDQVFLRIVLFASDGRLLHSSARLQAEPELADFVRDATHNFRSLPAANAVLVGHPRSTGDAWRVPLLTGVHSPGGRQGALVAVLDMGYLLQVFQEVNLGPGGRIEVIGDDGYQFVESSNGALASGREYAGSDYFHFLHGLPAGSGLIKRSGDAGLSVAAYSRLERYPLTVVVSHDQEDLLTDFNARRASYLRWAIFFSLVVITAFVSLIRVARRQRSVHQALADSETENRKLIARLEQETRRAYQLASHDHLTGLPNRMLFAELANSHLTRARRSRRYHAVFFIDLDRFKVINDTLGHRVGDLLLKEVARRLRTDLRESDVAARFGGDEFVMLVNDVDAIEDVAMLADKLVAKIKEPFLDLDGHDLELSPSIGIALFPQDGEDIEALLKHSDAAMYLAKAAGRGTYRFHDMALNKQAMHQLEMLQGLRRAVREGEFVLHYQPRVATTDFSIVGLEALVRWRHPDFGLVFPNEFIPLAEEHDLIAPLGLWVIEAACAQLADWRRRDIPVVPVAVNISAKQLRNDNVVVDVFDALRRHGLPPSLLEIEITESCLLEGLERVVDTLNLFAERGIKVAMDDYGTGFASLGYLKMLPLHAIKIDRSFVREIHNDPDDAMIVSSTTTLAHNLNLLVVAEGVETRDQLVHLKTIGCDQIQGYYFHRPAEVKEIEPILIKGKFVK